MEKSSATVLRDAPDGLIQGIGEEKEDCCAKGRYTILIVDDEVNILGSLRRLLRYDGYNILTEQSPRAGLSLIKDNDVALVIADNRMPGMNGAEFLAKVRDISPDTVRCMLTGFTDVSILASINNGVVTKYLTKPWDDDKLKDTIKEAIGFYDLIKRNNEPLSLKRDYFRQLLQKC